LLNSTLSSNTARFGRVFGRIERATAAAADWLTRVTRTQAVAVAVLIVVTAVVFGFVDPDFGFDLASFRLVLSLGLALFVITYVASRVTGTIVKRRWSVDSSIVIQPVALIFAVVGVIVARVLEFSPGFLIGLVIGMELAHRASAAHRTRAVVLRIGVIVALAVVAWVAGSIAVALQGDAPADFVSAMLQDTLTAITAEGLTATTIGLLPIGYLEGRALFDRSRPLWVALFLIVGTVFALLVLPTALLGQEVSNVVLWISVLLAFAAVTLVLWAWLRASTREPEPAEQRSLQDAS